MWVTHLLTTNLGNTTRYLALFLFRSGRAVYKSFVRLRMRVFFLFVIISLGHSSAHWSKVHLLCRFDFFGGQEFHLHVLSVYKMAFFVCFVWVYVCDVVIFNRFAVYFMDPIEMNIIFSSRFIIIILFFLNRTHIQKVKWIYFFIAVFFRNFFFLKCKMHFTFSFWISIFCRWHYFSFFLPRTLDVSCRRFFGCRAS